MAKLDVKVLDKKQNTLTLSISNITSTKINTLRRTIVDNVPVMAIEDVEIRKNSSILYDEIIAHRLGLIPLETDLKSYNIPETCSCNAEGCAKCQLELTLKVKGPKTVYASNIKSKDPKVVPVYDKMPIVKLAEGQELELIATARLGYGKVHSKWAPGSAWYSFSPTITVNANSKKLDEFKDKYPPQIFDKKGKIDKNLINTPSLFDACEGVCDDIVKITYNQESYIFHLESWGQLPPKEILLRSVQEFKGKVDEFTKLFKKL